MRLSNRGSIFLRAVEFKCHSQPIGNAMTVTRHPPVYKELLGVGMLNFSANWPCHVILLSMMYLSDRQRIDTQKVGLYVNWPELAALLQQITMFCMVNVYVYIHEG